MGISSTTIEVAKSRHSAAMTGLGMSILVLTFLMAFLYGQVQGSWYGNLLLQMALALAIFASFAFSFSAIYSDCLIVDVDAGDARRVGLHRLKSEQALGIGLSSFSLVPVLALFALNLIAIGVFGAALWCGYGIFVTLERRMSRSGRVP